MPYCTEAASCSLIVLIPSPQIVRFYKVCFSTFMNVVHILTLNILRTVIISVFTTIVIVVTNNNL